MNAVAAKVEGTRASLKLLVARYIKIPPRNGWITIIRIQAFRGSIKK